MKFRKSGPVELCRSHTIFDSPFPPLRSGDGRGNPSRISIAPPLLTQVHPMPAQRQIELTEQPINYAVLVEGVRSHLAAPSCCFWGRSANMTAGKQTASLDYEAYSEMAIRQLHGLIDEAETRWPVQKAGVIHRLGHLELGDIAVAVAVSCPHRTRSVRVRAVDHGPNQGSRPDLEEGELGRWLDRVGPSRFNSLRCPLTGKPQSAAIETRNAASVPLRHPDVICSTIPAD